jgi:lysophospholipase L1-like esterase
MKLVPGSTIVFQGDSITDTGRERNDESALGQGYVSLTAARLQARFPTLGLRLYNRGISGNRTADLLQRWDADCIDLEPDVLTILIGINNVWRRYDSADPTSVETFAEEYRRLLTRARRAGVGRIVMLEPFVLPVPEDRTAWREDLDPKIAVCRELAAEFETEYIPLDGALNAAALVTGPAYWAPDGVHPSLAGHGFIAELLTRQLIGGGTAWLDGLDA